LNFTPNPFILLTMGTFITLTTDFGLSDGYVAAMKGVIYSLNPEATIVDISHQIQPQNIREAAFVLYTAYSYFPSYTVHLAVVDPGVGSNRRAIILKTPKAHFVAPDNGVLSYIIDAFSPQPLAGSQRVKVGPQMKAYAITRSEYWRKPVSTTFHGRDIFAPVAARLSLGLMASSLGDEIDTVIAFPIPHPSRREDAIIGHILHIDNFGNLITDVRKDNLPPVEESVTIETGVNVIRGIVSNYTEREGPLALFGSSGYLEISVAGGSAAALFKARIGDEIKIRSGGN
jgi:S-adenosylmethionine hydrolase